MADESTVRDLILRAQEGEALTPAEVEQVTAWMRDDLGPAVRQVNRVLVEGLGNAMKQFDAYLASPEGAKLAAAARAMERQRA